MSTVKRTRPRLYTTAVAYANLWAGVLERMADDEDLLTFARSNDNDDGEE